MTPCGWDVNWGQAWGHRAIGTWDIGTRVRGHCIVCMAETLCHLLTCHRLPCLPWPGYYFHFASSLEQQQFWVLVLHIHLSLIRNIIKEMNEWLTEQMNEWAGAPSPLCLHWELRNCCASRAQLPSLPSPSLTVSLLAWRNASLSNAIWQLFLKRHTSFIPHCSTRLATHIPFPLLPSTSACLYCTCSLQVSALG